MMRKLALVLTIAVAAGCSGGGSDDGASSPTPTPTATPTGTPVANPLFETDIVPILNASCGTSNNSCHSRVAYGAQSASDCRGWLSLEDAMLGAQFYAGPDNGNATGCVDRPLYDRLTAGALANSWQCGPPVDTAAANVPYVVPGDPAGSYLYRKISGGAYCGTPSDPMPPTGALPAFQVETIRRWIEQGALRAL